MEISPNSLHFSLAADNYSDCSESLQCLLQDFLSPKGSMYPSLEDEQRESRRELLDALRPMYVARLVPSQNSLNIIFMLIYTL